MRGQGRIIGKVCYMYAQGNINFDDLYQEVLVNIWQGMASFEGRAKVSSWVWRVTINTCISSNLRSNRHKGGATYIGGERNY